MNSPSFGLNETPTKDPDCEIEEKIELYLASILDHLKIEISSRLNDKYSSHNIYIRFDQFNTRLSMLEMKV